MSLSSTASDPVASTLALPSHSTRSALRRKLWNWLIHPITQNIAIWLLALMPFTVAAISENKTLAEVWESMWKFFLPSCLYFAFPIYTHAFLIAPLFQREKYLLFVGLFVVNVLFWTSLVFLTSFPQSFVVRGVSFPIHFFVVGSITFFAGLIRIARDSMVRGHESRKAELQLLKDQLNPHFLFNTLNNLYGLAVVKSERLPGLMLQLSDLLRYSLYETREMYVPLERELQYIRNYVALESVRLGDKAKIDFQIKGEAGGYQIAPLLLISFIENGFKHQGSAPGEDTYVQIQLEVKDHHLLLHTRNSCAPLALEANKTKQHSGIGLKNARERLQLLYPGRHRLESSRSNDEFVVRLEIALL